MNVDEMGQTALNEAAKLVAMQVLGAGATVGSRVLQLFRRKATNAETLNFAEIERQFLAAAAQDPDWAVEVAAAVADDGVGRRVLSCGLPPDPFRDRVGLVERVPERGVCVLAGRRGSGRTAAARQIAFARRDRFPRYGIEVEFAKFRGSDGALAVVEVQRHILQQLGIDRDEQAVVEADLTAQYGSAMATRRVQLILRGVRGADELKPFEPTSFANPVLATTGYLGEDLRKDYLVVPLGGLDPEGAWQLLADRCGEEMLVAEAGATRELLEICDYLPEPVRAVGGALSRRRGQAGAVSAKVEHLRSVGLADAIGAVRDSLDETFAELPPGAGTACARLAVHPGFDFDLASAGAVLGQDAENVVDALNDTSLLVNMGRGRWRLQYSVRQYARHLADDAGQVVEKLVNFFRDCAEYADDEDEEERLRVYPREPRGARPDIPGRLIDYLDSNRHVILDLVQQAQERGYHEQICQLGGALEVLVNKRGGYGWYVSLNKMVLASATHRVGDHDDHARRAMVARAHATQGRMFTLLGQYDEADAHLRRATEATAELDHAQLTASLCEFWGQLHHERARQQKPTNVSPAVDALMEALRIDRQIDDERAAHIHARKLADVYITGGQLAAAWALLTDASTSRFAHGRNLARVQMVRARAALAGGDPASAYGWLTDARSLLDATRTTQYNREMDELTATAATMTGQFELARNIWTRLASEAHFTGHPRMRAYLTELERLAHC